jgi:8-oxo-dGTP pyrophosphatase MutT (NUDIX family)
MANNQLFEVSLKTIIKNKDGKILVLKERSNPITYDFPGGRIQKGEESLPLNEVLYREIIEEVGPIKFELSKKPAAVGRHSYTGDDGSTIHLIWIFFEAKFLDGKVVVSTEHTSFDWVDLNIIKLEEYFSRGSLDGMKNYLNRQ